MRVTQQMLKFESIAAMQNAENESIEIQNRIASGKDVNKPSDDPLRFVTAARFKSIVNSKEQNVRNISDARRYLDDNNFAVQSITELLQRTRILMLQSSNETLTTADMRINAVELRQSLEGLVQFANSSSVGGKIFGGSRTDADPFEVVRDANNTITDVIYRGDSAVTSRQIAEGTVVDLNIVGSKLFQVDADTARSSFSTSSPTEIIGAATPAFPAGNTTGFFTLQGRRVYFDTTRDSLTDIAARINDKAPEMEASVVQDSVTGRRHLQIATREADQIFADDEGSGRFLERMGLTDGTPNAPANEGAGLFTDRSIFSVLIDAIENLENGNPGEARNRIAELDRGLANLAAKGADIAATVADLENGERREEDFILQAREVISANEDLDLAKAVSDLRRAQVKLQTAVSASQNVPGVNLLQFL